MAAIAGNQPFILKPDGLGWLYAPAVKDGPLPTHYEPVESPVGNLLYPKQTCSPTVRFFEGPLNRIAHTPTAEYPVVATTFRLTEHYLSGPMSRFNSWLNELQPEMFVELSPELAAERGIVHGGWLTVQSARGRIEARAMVTRRLRPLLVEGRVIHQIGLPFHWAFAGEVVGGNANDLTALVADPNVSMHESKAFACQVHAGRLGGRAPDPDETAAAWPTRDPVPDTPAAAQPEGRFGTWPVREKELAALPPGGDPPRGRSGGAGGSPHRPVPPWGSSAAASGHGFYTDTTVCIGCKACEVACKQWNQLPADGFHWTGNSYDNTGELSATSWRHVKFIEQFSPATSVRRHSGIALDVVPAPRPRRESLADDERRLQALRHGPLPAGLPDRRHHPQRVRERLHPARHLQRLLVLHRRLPLRRHHPRQLRRPFAQVHALLRPAAGRPGPGLRQGVSDGVDPVRADRRAARTRPQARGGASPPRRGGRAPVRRCARRDLLRPELVLPPGRSSLGVRPARQAVQPVAAHGRRLRPRSRRRRWPPSLCSSLVFLFLGH